MGIVRRSFDVPCFALQVINDVGDINHITENILAASNRRREAKADILKIAFFDIWLCNEDRHSENYNLLYKYVEGNYVIYPIDHEACFNHSNLERGLDLIDYESSLIYSTLFSKLFNQQDFGNNAYLDNLKQTFYLCISTCRANLNNCLQIIPAGWNINTVQKEQEIQQYLFNNEWVDSCWNQFLHFLQLFSNP